MELWLFEVLIDSGCIRSIVIGVSAERVFTTSKRMPIEFGMKGLKMGRIMTRPKKLRDNRMDTEKDERVLPQGESSPISLDLEKTEAPKPRRYVPPQCTMCTALRGDDKADYTRIMSTQRDTGIVVRYCKCGFCGNTFKAIERV